MNSSSQALPQLFKGIALFTPGGDLIYCIDPAKQNRWHLQLCAALQEILGLSEPPHFLVPCYTATVDRWLDPQTQQIRTSAEAFSFALRHQALLNAIFALDNFVWQSAPAPEGLCDPMVLETHRAQFPQLWQEHDLVVRFERAGILSFSKWQGNAPSEPLPTPRSPAPQTILESTPDWESDLKPQTQGYVLRLFVSGITPTTERTLQNLHQLLEQFLRYPYTLKVIDIVKHPEQAEANQVSATPTLVRVWPQPTRRIIGELDNSDKILQALRSL